MTEPPQTKKHWPVIPCASSDASATAIGDMFEGSSGSNTPSSGFGSSPKVTSVMRVRAFGAMQLTVTPYRASSCAAISVKPAIPAFAAP